MSQINKNNETRQKKPKNKFNTELCDDKMTFEECELTILRHAVDETADIQGKDAVDNDDIKKMILILENFLIRKKCICYGGTAINNILPKDVQFYNREIEIPDYDFFSKNALVDAKELADIFFSEGFTDVEAKSGVHKGTYKVFVNFIPIADITSMVEEIYDNLAKEAITILGIRYCPPNYLRMSIYLELSRPAGDVSRWEKVFKRLNLLNKYYPLKPLIDCKKVKQQNKTNVNTEEKMDPTIFSTIRDTLIQQGVVFFGGYAAHLYSNYMPEKVKRITNKIPEFDVLVIDHDKCAQIVKERLEDAGFTKVDLIEHDSISDIIPKHTEIQIDGKAYVFIYEPIACHNYNIIEIGRLKVNIATIDTMLSFYLAFIYLNNEYYNKDRIICLAKYLYEVENHNRLEQNNILKRFSTKCLGKQHGLSDIRAEKAEMFKKLSKKKGSKEYEEWFLKYVPSSMSKTEQSEKKKKVEKYVEEDEHAIEETEKNPEYGEETHPKSIISKYKTKKATSSINKSIPNSKLEFNADFNESSLDKKQSKTPVTTKEEKEEKDEKDEKDEEHEVTKIQIQKEQRKPIVNKTHKKSKFWKKFSKRRRRFINNEFQKKNKTKKWFGLF